MLTLISNNNNLSVVDRLRYDRVALNDSETEALLEDQAGTSLIAVNSNYRPFISMSEELEAEKQPTLKDFARGPFTLAVANQGERLDYSMLSFELVHMGDAIKDHPDTVETESGIIVTSRMNLIPTTVALVPFVDIFRPEITKEAERAERLLKAAKTQSLSDARARRDDAFIRTATTRFTESVYPDLAAEKADGKITTGMEAIMDSLAPSLDASSEFYEEFWGHMREFYEPAIRHLGEEYALGHTTLESPALIKV